jgi:hypothetical protein
MPLPAAIHQGSIYENQTDASRRYFAVTEAPVGETSSRSLSEKTG